MKHLRSALIAISALSVLVIGIILIRSPRTEVVVVLSEHQILASRNQFAKGETIRLVVTNVGLEVHELEVEGFNREISRINPGETPTLIFRTNRSGHFEFVCRLEGHYEQGMRMPFTVTD